MFPFQVIQYFSSRLEQVQEKEGSLGVQQIQDFIRQTAIQFPREKLTVMAATDT